MASLQKIYDLICHHLGIQIFICLDCDLIKLTGTSCKVIHGRIRHVNGHRHAIIGIADKSAVLLLCGNSADAERFGQIIAGDIQSHSHYIVRSKKPLRISIGDYADIFSLFHLFLPEIASVLHRSIVHQFCILSLSGHSQIKITFSGYSLTDIGI